MFKKFYNIRCNSVYNLDDIVRMWYDRLLDVALSIFKYTYSTYEEYLFSVQLEKMLINFGVAGVIKNPNTKNPLAVITTRSNPSLYYDLYVNGTYSTPVSSGDVKFNQYRSILAKDYDEFSGKDGVLIFNDKTQNGLFDLILSYATTLAHFDVSIRNVSINMREPALVPCASTKKFFTVLEDYRKAIFKGKFKPIEDLGFSTIKMVENKAMPSSYLDSLVESRKKMLQEFYNLCGVKSNNEKKGNMIVEEVNSNDNMLEINIGDMLESRRIGIELVNNMFDTNIEVIKNKGVGGDESF